MNGKIVALAGLLLSFATGCKPDVQRPETVSERSARPVVIGGWKLGMPGPSANVLAYERRLPVELPEGARLLPTDGSLSYVLTDFYGGYAQDSLNGIIYRSPDNDAPLTVSTVYSYTFYTDLSNTLVLKMRCDAQLNGPAGNVFEAVYEAGASGRFVPDAGGYPPIDDVREVFLEAVEGIAAQFAADERWRN